MASTPAPASPSAARSPWPISNPNPDPWTKPWAVGDVDDDDDLRGISGSIKYNVGSEMERPP